MLFICVLVFISSIAATVTAVKSITTGYSVSSLTYSSNGATCSQTPIGVSYYVNGVCIPNFDGTNPTLGSSCMFSSDTTGNVWKTVWPSSATCSGSGSIDTQYAKNLCSCTTATTTATGAVTNMCSGYRVQYEKPIIKGFTSTITWVYDEESAYYFVKKLQLIQTTNLSPFLLTPFSPRNYAGSCSGTPYQYTTTAIPTGFCSPSPCAYSDGVYSSFACSAGSVPPPVTGPTMAPTPTTTISSLQIVKTTLAGSGVSVKNALVSTYPVSPCPLSPLSLKPLPLFTNTPSRPPIR